MNTRPLKTKPTDVRAGEDGFALVAAVASIFVFAVMSLVVLSAARGAIVSGRAEIGAAKAAAAADAGLSIALQGLLAPDRTSRWSIDGRTRSARFADAALTIRVEDERGKIPINKMDEEYAPLLLANLGLSGDRLRVATASLLDWLDDDDEPRSDGAESDYYLKFGIRPRNGALQSIAEARSIRGFDAAMVEKLEKIATIYAANAAFDPRFAQPDAIAVMTQSGADSPAVIERTRELAGQRTAIEIGDPVNLIGRPLSLTVVAQMPDGARARRTEVIELTGSSTRPYVVRSYD